VIHAILVSTPDCHLCARARDVLETVGHGEIDVTELDWDSPEGQALVAQEGIPFPPAVFVAGKLVAYGRVAEGALRKRLEITR
jgi:glutaredoxin